MEEKMNDPILTRKAFSRLGWALCVILTTAILVQVAVLLLGPESFFTTSTGMWIMTFVPIYGIAIPAGLLMLRRLPCAPPRRIVLGFKGFLSYIPMAICLMYVGNLIGSLLAALLSGGSASNAVVEYAMDTNPLKVVVVVIMAPLLEEYVFRKQIIDRMGCYGEKTAVVLSAVVFGLFHTNLFQFFYAVGLGLLMGYLYIRTGRLRYSVILHGIINFMGSVLAPFIVSRLDFAALESMDPNLPAQQLAELYMSILPGLALYYLYAVALLVLSVVGLVLLITRWKRTVWLSREQQIPEGAVGRTVYANAGMVVYFLLSLALTALSLM